MLMILLTGNDNALIQSTISALHAKFALKVLGEVSYFLGFEAYRNSDGIYLTQMKYDHDLLAKTNMLNAKSCSTPLCSSTKLSLVGKSFSELLFFEVLLGLYSTSPIVDLMLHLL
ncbi:hypothetical protein ACOSP7_030199 [Xanthoceras sorbifolium]